MFSYVLWGWNMVLHSGYGDICFVFVLFVIIEMFPISVLQAEAMEHYAGDNDHGKHEL